MNKPIEWFRFYGGICFNDTWEYDNLIIPELIKEMDFEESEHIRIIF